MSRDWKDEVQATSRAQVARSIPESILSTGKYRVSAAWGRRPHRAQDRRICMHDLLFRAGRATPRQWIPRPVSHRDAPEHSRCLATGPVSRAVPFTGRVSLTQGPVLLVANQGATLTPQVVIESLGHIGASTKSEGEAIGHKGIGFKSALEMSSQPELYSGLQNPGPTLLRSDQEVCAG